MLDRIITTIKGLLSFLCYAINTVFFSCPIIFFAFFKLIPITASRAIFSRMMDFFASSWIQVNGLIQRFFTRTQWEIRGDIDKLSLNGWYLVLSNHQSWVDILVLQKVLNKRIPFLKFFLKKELIYVPVLGVTWWALDFPFMQRFTKAQIAKNPSLRGKDLETTKKACEKFKDNPVSVMNFIEGTRFTPSKHHAQQSAYQQLLTPKAGGVAFALQAMGDHLQQLVDVTIFYPERIPSFWDYIAGNVPRVVVDIKLREITKDNIGDYQGDEVFRLHFKDWLNQLWSDKDQTLLALKAIDEK